MPPLLILLIILAIAFDFLNGVHDSSNIVATMISSRAISPRAALAMTAVAEFSGPFILGVAVATTIGEEIVASELLRIEVLMAALLSAIIWNILTWLLGIPSSSSHALIGGIVGGVGVGAGLQAIKLAGVLKVLISLFISPLIGLVADTNFSDLVATVGGVSIRYGAFITAIINFLLMAVVLFLLVKAINATRTLGGKFKRGEPGAETPAAPTEKACPYCKLMIPAEATRCPHCTSEIKE